MKFAKIISSKNYFLFCFGPICYWIIFVVLNVWHNVQKISQELWKHSLSRSKLFWEEFLLLLLICFMSHLLLSYQKPCFWPVFKSKYIEEWVRPANVFIYWCFCFGTEVTKTNGMERFNFFTFLSILLLATCEGLRKAFFIYYYYYFFVIFIFLFQSLNILSQEDILSKIYCHKNFFVFDIF